MTRWASHNINTRDGTREPQQVPFNKSATISPWTLELRLPQPACSHLPETSPAQWPRPPQRDHLLLPNLKMVRIFGYLLTWLWNQFSRFLCILCLTSCCKGQPSELKWTMWAQNPSSDFQAFPLRSTGWGSEEDFDITLLLVLVWSWGAGCVGSGVKRVSHNLETEQQRGLLVAVPGLSCPMACGILVPWSGIEPETLAVESRFLTTGPPGKSQRNPILLLKG